MLSVTLWLRLVGAVGSGWLADRVGRLKGLIFRTKKYAVAPGQTAPPVSPQPRKPTAFAASSAPTDDLQIGEVGLRCPPNFVSAVGKRDLGGQRHRRRNSP